MTDRERELRLEDLRDRVLADGLEYTVLHYCSPEMIADADPRLAAMIRKAQEAFASIRRHLSEQFGPDWEQEA